jgi:hypothetical protein
MAKNKSTAAPANGSTQERFRPFHTHHDHGYIVGGGQVQAIYLDADASTDQLASLAQAKLSRAIAQMRILSCCRSEVAVEPHEFAECFLPAVEEVSQLLDVITARR